MPTLLALALFALADNPKIAVLAQESEQVGYRDGLARTRMDLRARGALKAMMDVDEIRTGNDFMAASGLVGNAPGYESRLLAHEWALSALVLGHPDAPKRVRLTWDLLQLDSGRPQRFGSISRRGVPRETDPTLASLDPAKGSDNPELEAMKKADQADREGAEGSDERDAARRARVMAILKEGKATTGPDAFNAALVLQHGERYEDFMLAHELCLSTIARGNLKATWLATRTYDRMLENGGRAQRFGTQGQQNRPDSPEFIVDADYPGPSDTTRALLKSPSRAATRKGLDEWLKTISG